MESLGKTEEGIAVCGGSSDQHSYLQQLMEGPDNFTVNFINIRNFFQIPQVLPNGNYTGDYLFACFGILQSLEIYLFAFHGISSCEPEQVIFKCFGRRSIP